MTPAGIIMQSSSQGATQEAIEKVLTDNGYEPEKVAAAEGTEPIEPKREDFETDEAFDQAKEEFDAKAEEREEKEAQEQERQEAERPKTRKQKAIEKATKDLRDQLRTANERLAALEGKATKTEVIKAPEAPKRADFKDDAAFEEAMFDYRYKLRRAKETAEQAQNNLKAQLEENYTTYQSAVSEFKDDHDDWDDVVNSKTEINESTYLSVIELGKDGPAVTYYLGKHPDYARQLSQMSPHSAAMEVGRLSSRLKTGARVPREASNGAPRKPKPRLPEPVKPLSTAATSSTVTSAEAAKKGNYRAFKAAQRAGR